jgi:putative FmdB family regulatory protein
VPTYSYVCTECETPLEVQQSFSDDALTVCPTCEGRLRKVFSAVGVVFKGSGFYRTDSRAGSGSDSGGDSGGTSTKDGDAAAKPAAAKESGSAAKADTGSGSVAKSSKAPAAASSGGRGGSSSASKTGSAA